MLLFHGMPATAFRPWVHDVIELESKFISTTVLTPKESARRAGSWIDIDEELNKMPESECTISASISSMDHEYALLYDATPLDGRIFSGTTFANDSHGLDTTTLPIHAIH